MRLITKSKIKEYALSEELASNGIQHPGEQPQAMAVLSVRNPKQQDKPRTGELPWAR
jgi:hypothetical protein